jgi:hypothetical protein
MNLDDIKETGIYIAEDILKEPCLLEVYQIVGDCTWQIIKTHDRLFLRRVFNHLDSRVWSEWEFLNDNSVWEKFLGIIGNTDNIIVQTNEKE